MLFKLNLERFGKFAFIAKMSESKKIFYACVWFCFCFERPSGVFGVETEEIKMVMEGDSVILETEIRKDDQLLWRFGQQGIVIAQVNNKDGDFKTYKGDGRFEDTLELSYETGSLIIKNIRTEHAGLYRLQIIRPAVLTKRFRVSVYSRLPVPVITRDCSSSSSSLQHCSVVCSVVNLSDVSLSWHKENLPLSETSTSKLSISLSLPLEVEYLEKNTFSCVVKNPISNQTEHLDINKLCQPCPAPLPVPIITRESPQCSSSLQSNCLVVCSVVNVSAVSLSWYKEKSLLSIISVSDLSISLSLPLEVEYQENNTYSCVVNNTISRQTQHLDINRLCQPCPGRAHCCGFTETIIRLVSSALIGVATVAVLVYDVRSRRSYQKRRQQMVSSEADDYDDAITAP